MHSRSIRFIFSLAAALALGALLTTPAAALDPEDELTDSDQVVMNGQLLVAEGDTVDSAVLFHGSASVEGTVTGSLVVFDGRTDISGHVQEDVFVFNGDVTVRSGAQIDGDLVTSQTPTVESGATIGGEQQRVSSRFDWGAIGFASRLAWWFGYSVSTLLLGLLLLLIAPGLDAALVRSVRERMGASIGLGALIFFLLPIVAIILVVIVVAIPLGIFMLLALGLLYTLGYVAGAHAIGRLLVKVPTSRFLGFLAGWAIVRLIGLIPVVGGLAWTLVSVFGLGALWVASRRAAAGQIPAQAIPPAPTAAA